MRISVQRLRRWLLVGVGLLVVVIAAFLGYARYRTARFLKGFSRTIPKLGIEVKQQGGVFTFTKTVGSKPIYTIHASKGETLNDGRMTLHDVSILFYDRDQNHTDQMRAGEADYDPSTGVAHAVGEVQLDLQMPAEGQAPAAPGSKGDNVIHATMQGVTFLKEFGVAATEKEVDFQVRGMTGHSVGAEYNVDSGVLVLQSAVRMVGVNKGKPAELTAARAEYNRLEQKATLTQVKYVSAGKGGPMSAEAKDALVTLRHDGSVQQVDASGDVTLASADGKTLRAAKMQMQMNEKGEPKSVHGFGGLHFVDDEPLRKGDGVAAEGQLLFDAAGRPQHLTTTGAVRLTERQRGSQAEPWTTRTINAETANIDFAPQGSGSQVEMREARANGSPQLELQTMEAASAHSPGGMADSTMSADRFDVKFTGAVDGLAHLHGEGRTELRRVGADGAVGTSRGDVIDAIFHSKMQSGNAGKKTVASAKQSGENSIVSAVQQGHVVMTDLPAQKPGETKPQEPERGTANRAEYDGVLQRVTLVGDATLVDAGSNVKADRIVMNRVTDDAEAQGSVKASLVQSDAVAAKSGGDAQVVHVTADHALVHRATQIAEFYGSVTRPARLWQEASQVEAPVLIFVRAQKVLTAHGDGQQAAPVHSVFANAGAKGKTNVIEVASRELRYSDVARQGVFTGGVEVQSVDGTMTAQRAEVFLQPAGAGAKSGVATGMLGGDVEWVVVTGGVKIVQPGRHGTGEQLVYTASDGKFVMTGTASAPPKIVDDQGRSETGASLIFHRGDDSVLISGKPASAGSSGQRVRTETRVKQSKTQ